MIGVLIIPTGIGAEIGGHAGDANPVCKLLAECCDRLITHPNVVNASDINEMPRNVLYVEGSILDRFLEGVFSLVEVKQNRVLVAANAPVTTATVNAVSAARATIGLSAEIVELEVPLEMIAAMRGDGVADGRVSGWNELIAQVREMDYDALAIHSPIIVDRDRALHYFHNGGVNPWGGVEALASELIATQLVKPVAHAPLEEVTPDDDELYFVNDREAVDPRIASEVISNCFLHSVLKGLHTAPRVGKPSDRSGLMVDDVDFMVSPWGCFGRPHIRCMNRGVPVIMVKENKTVLNDEMDQGVIVVENYWEAVGIVMAMRAGIDRASVRRPLAATAVHRLTAPGAT